MSSDDVYLLALHDPYRDPEYAEPINATIIHARTLLHPLLPQPDGGRMYRCLTEPPGRRAVSVVPLSTLTWELDGGRLWPQIGDWEQVVAAAVRLSRSRRCDAIPVGLPPVVAALLAGGPNTTLHLALPGGASALGPSDRQIHLDEITGHVQRFAAQRTFWPGDSLVDPPTRPAAMPFQPSGR